jgi:hypothetical protein
MLRPNMWVRASARTLEFVHFSYSSILTRGGRVAADIHRAALHSFDATKLSGAPSRAQASLPGNQGNSKSLLFLDLIDSPGLTANLYVQPVAKPLALSAAAQKYINSGVRAEARTHMSSGASMRCHQSRLSRNSLMMRAVRPQISCLPNR